MTTQELQQIWPEWEIIRPLGEGAFGKVYEIRRGEGRQCDGIAPRYGLVMLGGEIGVFAKPTTQATEHYSALPSEEETQYLFTRGPQSDWWLTGFVPGSFYEYNKKSEIIVLANIQFPELIRDHPLTTPPSKPTGLYGRSSKSWARARSARHKAAAATNGRGCTGNSVAPVFFLSQGHNH